MPDPKRPSREAREAALEALRLSGIQHHLHPKRWADAVHEASRVLDAFAEKARREAERACLELVAENDQIEQRRSALRQERDALRKAMNDVLRQVQSGGSPCPGGLTVSGPFYAREIRKERDALRQRVAALETEVEEYHEVVQRDRVKLQDMKARAERAEKALDDVIALREQAHTPEAWMLAMMDAVDKLKEARRARGDS